MAEGDSVYRLAARLRPRVVGRTIRAGELRSGNAAGTDLAGVGVTELDTHGKHLLFRFDNRLTLHTHLLMQGSWTLTRPDRAVPPAVQPKVRVRMALADGCLWGIDLPVVQLAATAAEHTLIGHLGPDPLRADWNAEEAIRRLARRPDRTLVGALLDQRNLAGLGNLWVNEVAFLSGVHPLRPIGELDVAGIVERAARLLYASATVPGLYQVTTGRRRRGERHWVVGRAGRPCLRCDTTVQVRAEVPGDPERRRTWWCPRCQR